MSKSTIAQSPQISSPYFRMVMIHFAIAIISFYFLVSCGHAQPLSTWCVPAAIHNAVAWHIKSGPVRMAVSHISKGVDHVQAEALIEGSWIPLTEIWDGKSMAVVTHKRHFDIMPYRYLTLREFFDEQIK